MVESSRYFRKTRLLSCPLFKNDLNAKLIVKFCYFLLFLSLSNILQSLLLTLHAIVTSSSFIKSIKSLAFASLLFRVALRLGENYILGDFVRGDKYCCAPFSMPALYRCRGIGDFSRRGDRRTGDGRRGDGKICGRLSAVSVSGLGVFFGLSL